MIVFDLSCAEGHLFEGWFGSSDDFTAQQGEGLLTCPQCGCGTVEKAPMAPSVPAKANQQLAAKQARQDETTPFTNHQIPPEVQHAMMALAKAQVKALEDSRWVGGDFAEQSRAMHYGERDLEAIHGKATLEEAQDLLNEGIEIAPLPFPVAEPDQLN